VEERGKQTNVPARGGGIAGVGEGAGALLFAEGTSAVGLAVFKAGFGGGDNLGRGITIEASLLTAMRVPLVHWQAKKGIVRPLITFAGMDAETAIQKRERNF